jgi:hypothetical protein
LKPLVDIFLIGNMHISPLETQNKLLVMLLFEPQKARRFLSDHKTGTAPSRPVPDWPRLVEMAQQEGVSAVLFHNITSHHLEDLVPQERCRALSNQYYANLKRNLSIVGALRVVLAIFQEAGISCIVLKGIALAERVYPNIALRGMSDVDILVRKADLFKVDDHLSSLGYTSRDSSVTKAIHNPAGYLASLEYRRIDPSPLNLHVHWHPVNTSVPAAIFAERIDTDRLWEKAATVAIADSQALMLTPEHLIIYLCEHALRVGHSFDRIILVCDIFYAIKAYEKVIDWDFMIEESRRFNLSRFVYHGLSIVKHHTSSGIPDACIAKLRPPDLSWGEKYFLELQFDNRRIRGSSYFIYLAMNRGLFAKIEFIARTFFPPARILLQRQYRKDAEFSKSLYLLRIGEILSQMKKILK